MSFRILVLTSVEQKSQETTRKVDQISQILKNNYYFSFAAFCGSQQSCQHKGTDYVGEGKCGYLQLTNCKIYLTMVLKLHSNIIYIGNILNTVETILLI